MVWAWIGVGVVYFSCARARRIGSARPNSLNEVNESLSIWRTGRAAIAAGGIAGSSRHPAWPGLSLVGENGGGGAKFVLMSFVHAARKPEIGSFIRWRSYDS